MIRHFAITIFLCSVYGFIFAQPGGSVRVEVLGGGYLNLVFNSIAKYKNGITTQPDYTTIGITAYEDPLFPPVYVSWELTVEFDDQDLVVGDNLLNGSVPANDLPFSTVEVSSATVGAGCASCVHLYAGPSPPPATLALTNAPQLLVSGVMPPDLAFATDWIGITYYVGTTVSLLGQPADFYSDEIIFTITMSP